MWYTKIYSNIIVYKNIKGHPLKQAVVRAVCTRAQVQRLKESQLTTIRGDGDQEPVTLRRFRQGPSYTPNRLVSQRATLLGMICTRL